MENLNLDILKLCNDLGINLHQLAKIIDYDYPNLHKIANNQRAISMTLFLKLIDKLKIDANSLLTYRI